MAISFKTLTQDDKTTSRTLLHESIPITGTLISGTYAASTPLREINIKTYSHGMFQSVYDYPYISSSANHLFDITAGVSTASQAHGSLSSSANPDAAQRSKKVNIYNQMAQVLMGYDSDGKVRRFDKDGNLTGGAKYENALFLNFSRLLVKDEIKKGSFSLILGSGSYNNPWASTVTIADTDAGSSYKVNSPAGEYGLLKKGSTNVGLIYYQAGVVVLTASLFKDHADGGILNETNGLLSGPDWVDSTHDIVQAFSGSEISASADAFRHRIENVQFNNTTELNSTIYFCRANHNEFNYSSNPTYLSGSEIRIKNESTDDPVSYITTVGLYNDRRELLAVAKVSEPLKKTPDTEFTLRVRLDY